MHGHAVGIGRGVLQRNFTDELLIVFQVLCFEILWAFLLLISASLVAEVANYFGTLKSFGGSVVSKVYDPMVAAVVS